MTRRLLVLAAAVLAVAVLTVGVSVHAFINPNFTPKHLVEQSDYVAIVEFSKEIKDGKAVGEIKKVLKGKAPEKTITVDLSATARVEEGKAAEKMIAGGETRALLFVGMFSGIGGDDRGPGETAAGKLHLGGDWLEIEYFEQDKLWDFVAKSERLLGTWNGSDDMLLRCVEYILSDPDADVPVKTEANFGEPVKLGKMEAGAVSLRAVELAGDGKPCLHVASAAGDKLYAWDAAAKAFKDVAAARKLAAKSAFSAWGDFDGKGGLDLAASDGRTITLHFQRGDGSFEATPLLAKLPSPKGMKGLAALDCGRGAQTAILVSSDEAPVVLVYAEGVEWSIRTLPGEGADLGYAGCCLVADFDGDSLADIIRPFEKGGLFYKGTARGEYATGVATEVSTGSGISGSCIGDYDADGLPDIFVTGVKGNSIWQNLGGGRFAEKFAYTGEMSYISKPRGFLAASCDIDNDGRQDIFIGYSWMEPQLFFNRGFRSFGDARMFTPDGGALPKEIGQGVQAACAADLNSDGIQDIAAVMTDGELYVFPRKADGADVGLALRVALDPAGSCAGPVNVVAFEEKRSYGAWPVSTGSSAFFGRREAGPVTVKWRLPGGEEKKKEIVLEDRPVLLTIGGKD